MLSKENYERLNENFLYKKEPIFTKDGWGDYYCKNWTFRVRKRDGTAWMLDTYYGGTFDSGRYLVTDENIDEFEKVFDFREMRRLNDSEVENFEFEDLVKVATDSGGYSCGKLYWVKKDIEYSTNRMIENAEYKIQRLESQLELAKWDLERLLENAN